MCRLPAIVLPYHDKPSIEKFIAKATINCFAAQVKGASCASGALGTLVTDLLTTAAASDGPVTEEKIDQLQRNIKLTSAILGYFASEGKAENVYATNVAAQLDYDNNWFWLVVQAGFFGWTVYEVLKAAEGLIDTFDRMSADGELSPQEADELVQTAKTFGLTITFEVTAGKVVKGLKIAAIAGDFAVTAAKAIGLDRVLAKLNDRFQTIGGSGRNGASNDNVPSNAPKEGVIPPDYIRNADGTVSGPRGGTYTSTGQIGSDGKLVYRDTNGGYFTLDDGRTRVSAPTNYSSVPIHHICTNKCNVGANGNPAWTPQFQKLFDNAGLNINSEINKIAVPGHRGPHPEAYHQYVYGSLNDAVSGIVVGTPAYTQAVSGT